MTPRYRAEPAEHLVRRDLGDVSILFHRPSGQTHIVASPVPEMLEALGAQPLDADGLHAALGIRYDLGPVDEARAELARHLFDLEALGLVRIVP